MLRTCLIEPCNNAALRASCCSEYFKCNHCKVSFDNDHIPLLILFASNRNAPFTFPFSISCLNLDETFLMFIGVVFDCSHSCVVLLSFNNSLLLPRSHSLFSLSRALRCFGRD